MKTSRFLLLAVTALIGLSLPSMAMDPQIGNGRGYGDNTRFTVPMGSKRGVETTVSFYGSRLADTEEILFYRPGIEVVSFDKKESKKVTAKLKIEADCPLGEHYFRIRTKTGVTRIGTFHVNLFDNVNEKEPNNDFGEAQVVQLNQTVEGLVDREDIDYYKVTAKKGQRLSVEVEAVRLNLMFFDSFVSIMKADGTLLKESDDTAFARQDPTVSVVVPEDGEYLIQVRESAYGGNRNAYYRLHVGDFPRPQIAYPAGGKAGDKMKVKFIGDASGDIEKEIQLPASADAEFDLLANVDGKISPTPNHFRLADYGNALEVEPNNALAEATPVDAYLPVALNGILNKEGDIDCIKVKAKKGQDWHVYVRGKAIGSPIDSSLNIYDAKNKRLTGNDDSGGPDSYVRFKVPADGEYTFRVSDHMNRGGDDFVYRIEFEPYVPAYDLTIPHVARRDSQNRQAMVVPRGNRFVSLMNVRRKDGLRGDVALKVDGLPKGVTAKADSKIASNISTFPVVFEAAKDAPLGATFSTPTILSVGKEGTEALKAGAYRQRVDLVHASPNSTVYKTTDLEPLMVSVTEEVPFKINLIEPKAPVPQYGYANLKIQIEKKEGWDETVQVYLPFRSPGLSGHSRITIAKGKSEGNYPINTRYNAGVGEWKHAVYGYAKVGDGNAWIGSDLATINVVPRYLYGKFKTASVNLGETVKVTCTLTQKEAFEGKATLTLYGMPTHATAKPVEITKDSKEAVFEVTTSEKTPVGAHKRLYTKINFNIEGEKVDQMVATSGRLIVNKPKVDNVAADTKKVASAK